MNNPTIQTGIQEIPPVEAKSPTILTKISDKIPPKVKEIAGNFYANKKVFWPIVIVFGLLFLVVILGLLFGNKGQSPPGKKISIPTPFVQATPEPCSDSDQLCPTGNQLNELDNQINSLDVRQSRLKPPSINYDINF